jgi:hypothetical protein
VVVASLLAGAIGWLLVLLFFFKVRMVLLVVRNWSLVVL